MSHTNSVLYTNMWVMYMLCNLNFVFFKIEFDEQIFITELAAYEVGFLQLCKVITEM